MSLKKIITLNVMAAALIGCGGGDINIAPSTSTTTTGGGSGGSSSNTVCAAYTLDGTTYQGTLSGGNCVYDSQFVDIDNPLTVDVTFGDLDNNGVHVFDGSLVVGETYDNNADMSAAGIAEGGDGPTLRLGAGVTLAFSSSDDFMVINRGSQIIANGTEAEPITITSQSDAVFNVVGPEDVQEWGGLVINGFGVTNKCSYTGNRGDNDFALTSECHVVAEGKADAGESYYGGDNDADSSGTLRYFIVKHTGAEVGPGNELNGIAFNAVGSGTTVENLEAYSVYDDGIEFFGGAVDVTNYVAVYVRDDSIDIDEGYIGTIENALVVQSRFDGNHCVESDGIGSYDDLDQTTIDDFIARGLNSAATLRNVTCIVSANETGTHDPGAGLRIREGHFPMIENLIVSTAYSGDDALGEAEFNYCVLIEDASEQAALDGDLTIASSVVACQDLTAGDLEGSSTQAWLETGAFDNAIYQSAEAGEDPTAATNPDLEILNGFYSLETADMNIAGETVPTPASGASILGAVLETDDWTANWTYGLHPGSRGQDLWFE